jgi:broad specificity phosphatase PhoE
MARLFLVRHGETTWNLEGRAQGQSDTPLSDPGRQQAVKLAERLKSTTFTLAYSSDLSRALETAKTLLQGHDTHLKLAQDIREKRYGEWEGKSFKEVQEQYPELYKRLFAEDVTFAPPGGESDTDLILRVKPFASTIKSSHVGDENILIVAHGGSLRALLVNLLGLTVNALWRFRLSNSSVSIVSTYANGGVTLDLLNDTSHLEASFG